MSKPKLKPAGSVAAVSVPGSTSNLGPGFDCLGCAVSLRNEFVFEILQSGADDRVQLDGSRCSGIPPTPRNLALTTAKEFMAAHGIAPPPMHLRATIEVPSARGLGSSSTAIVAGLAAGNALLGDPLDRQGLLDAAVKIEGHPDNVAPAILGGLVVSAAYSTPLVYTRLAIHPAVRFLFVIPDYMVKTSDARGVLPKTVSMHDAIFNLSRTPLVIQGLVDGNVKLLRQAMEDKLHEPYRKSLFKGYDALHETALAAGGSGFCVSGAGPAMLAVCTVDAAPRVAIALKKKMAELGIDGSIEQLAPDTEGLGVS